MIFHNKSAEIYIPDLTNESDALARTTHLCIGAHQDDLEIMAAQPIIDCFHNTDLWFSGVVLSDGRGSPRNGLYRQTTDEEMQHIRKKEQRKAAFIGNYSSLVMLDYPSSTIKDAENDNLDDDLVRIFRVSKPTLVYTHNLADKHDTHVAVVLRVIKALRKLKADERPAKLIGCEVWRSLDWVNDHEKVVMDLSGHENLQHALLSVFDSQIAGGKRYDKATMSRRIANATFYESHGVDVMSGASFGIDLTPLVDDENIQPTEYINAYLDGFRLDVVDRITRMS